MPKKKHLPAYRLHKASGQARVIINGAHIYLGKYDSPESHERYARLMAENSRPHVGSAARDGTAPSSSEWTRKPIRVNELILAYIKHAEGYYVADGEPTGELDNTPKGQNKYANSKP